MSDPIRRVFDRGPFITRPLYRLGFEWEDEGELQPGWELATWDVPSWAKSDGIVGTWKMVRYRLVFRLPFVWWRIPLMPWGRRKI